MFVKQILIHISGSWPITCYYFILGRRMCAIKTKKKKDRELDGPWGVWVGVWFSSRLYYPSGKGTGQHIIRCLKNKKCENERIVLNQISCVLPHKHLQVPGPYNYRPLLSIHRSKFLVGIAVTVVGASVKPSCIWH